MFFKHLAKHGQKQYCKQQCKLVGRIEYPETVIINSYLFGNPWIEDVLINLIERGVNITILVEGNPVAGKGDKYSLKRLKEKGAIIYEMRSADE